MQAIKLLLELAQDDVSHIQWIGYLSSTSVYGDWGGDWVDERSADASAICNLSFGLVQVVDH